MGELVPDWVGVGVEAVVVVVAEGVVEVVEEVEEE
jgi:hypothetical protein